MAFLTVFTSLLLFRYQGRFNHEFIEKYFSELTDDQRDLYKGQLLYLSIFIFRRFLFIALIFLLADYQSLQLAAFMTLNLSYLIYSTHYKPMFA
jgi:hypothetical protein